MKKFTKALIVFALGAAAGAYASKNKQKLKKEINRLVKQGKIKSEEGKDIFDEIMKDVKARTNYEKKRASSKVKRKISKGLKKARKKINPPKKKATKRKVKKTGRKVKRAAKKAKRKAKKGARKVKRSSKRATKRKKKWFYYFFANFSNSEWDNPELGFDFFLSFLPQLEHFLLT